MQPDNALVTCLFAGKYNIVKKIANGSYATVYLGTDNKSNEEVAIKLESVAKTIKMLSHEVFIYQYLINSDRVPRVRYFGQDHGYNLIVMDLLGPSLRKLHHTYKVFSMGTVLKLANQILLILEFLHSHAIIHRDIKPSNFLIGRGNKSNYVYIIDFGLAIRYNKSSLPSLREKYFVGNALFASCNAHKNEEPASRDDLESLGYLLVYFLRGKLPWCDLNVDTFPERIVKVGEIKLATNTEELCKDLPDEFATYLKYCRGLQATEVPDYEYLRQLFDNLAKRLNFSNDNMFEGTQTTES